MQNVRYAYPNHPDRIILDIEKMVLPSGDRLLIHGPSGCGKSTLLNLLCGMLVLPQGELTVLGQRLDKMSQGKLDRFRAKHIGYVFQQFNLIPYLNAIENISMATYFSGVKLDNENKIEGFLEELNVSSADWTRPCMQLSVGQQQRVAIARALINQPELLIADEPTSSLDPTNRDTFMSLLINKVKSSGISLVFVSHDLSLARHFDRYENLVALNRAKEAGPCF